MMKVTYGNGAMPTTIGCLSYGDCFLQAGGVYMKTFRKVSSGNAVRLNDGELVTIGLTVVIEPITNPVTLTPIPSSDEGWL
jgi:hypothetical protein